MHQSNKLNNKLRRQAIKQLRRTIRNKRKAIRTFLTTQRFAA
jgi:hypothetical protein